MISFDRRLSPPVHNQRTVSLSLSLSLSPTGGTTPVTTQLARLKTAAKKHTHTRTLCLLQKPVVWLSYFTSHQPILPEQQSAACFSLHLSNGRTKPSTRFNSFRLNSTKLSFLNQPTNQATNQPTTVKTPPTHANITCVSK